MASPRRPNICKPVQRGLRPKWHIKPLPSPGRVGTVIDQQKRFLFADNRQGTLCPLKCSLGSVRGSQRGESEYSVSVHKGRGSFFPHCSGLDLWRKPIAITHDKKPPPGLRDSMISSIYDLLSDVIAQALKGKFALYVSLAKDQWSTAAAILTPAALAPLPLPPTPPKRSIALIFRLFLGIFVGIRECGRAQELKRSAAHPVSIDKVYSTRAMRACPSFRSLREGKFAGGT